MPIQLMSVEFFIYFQKGPCSPARFMKMIRHGKKSNIIMATRPQFCARIELYQIQDCRLECLRRLRSENKFQNISSFVIKKT